MTRYFLAALLAAIALLAMTVDGKPGPKPPPDPEGRLQLRGLFVGPTAGDDAITIACLCAELADVIAWDGRLDKPRLSTGVAFDDLRIAARESRMRGVSIGERQPHVRDAIHEFLDEQVGVSGGPVSDEDRKAWVAAYREIARAANAATR